MYRPDKQHSTSSAFIMSSSLQKLMTMVVDRRFRRVSSWWLCLMILLSTATTIESLLLMGSSSAATNCVQQRSAVNNGNIANRLVSLSAVSNTNNDNDNNTYNIEFQSDASKYGRGEMHLSAAVDRGDIVVYQTGTWLVDGVEVGDGSPPEFHYGLLETVQLVWTHNCEHGVLRALPLVLLDNNDNNDAAAKQILQLESSEECVEFGPEQLVAKLPLDWDKDVEEATASFPLTSDLWT